MNLEFKNQTDLILWVCKDYFEGNLFSADRKRENVLPRAKTMYLLRKYTTLTSTEIARIFNKNHATILHHIKTIKNDLQWDAKTQTEIEYLSKKIEELIIVNRLDVSERQKLLKSLQLRLIRFNNDQLRSMVEYSKQVENETIYQ